jgi:hypothetical protein
MTADQLKKFEREMLKETASQRDALFHALPWLLGTFTEVLTCEALD